MKSKLNKKITILLVAYNSLNSIKKLLKNIDSNFQFLIVDNSPNSILKNKLKFIKKNITLIVPKKNNGLSYAINIAAKKIRTEYILYMDSDVNMNTNKILKLLRKAEKIDKFGVLVPEIINGINYDKLIIKKNIKKNLHQVSFSTGCVMLFKNKIFRKMKYFDDQFFSYFEENDYFKRCNDNKMPVYLYNDVKIFHGGSKSIDKDLQFSYNKFRNWHYSWSKFYYYKKHFNYLVGVSKTFPNFVRSIKKILISLFQLEFKKVSLHYCELEGLISSYFLIKPFYRIE